MQPTQLGPYVIDKPLGKGGMGSVFAATDSQTGQRVAIKALSPQLAAADGFRERFEAEIESLKTLRHDGIVRLYGYGEQDGVLFYSMEIVDGISLDDELKAGRRFNWREVTNIAIQLSSALKHAHDHGIVHRDIKPANILLHNDEHVKLADFGIARLFGMTSLTTAGGVLGTADYMSPEQADGRPVTARCDQYSLGGVMYALLAGRPPFRAKNLPQMLQLQRFASPEPVRRYAPDTPEQLEHVIMQLLAKDPAERFPNTQVLARHLQAMINALSRPAADDFALTAEQVADTLSADGNDALSSLATQAEAEMTAPREKAPSRSSARTANLAASQNAATLAADAVVSSPAPGASMAPLIEPPAAERAARFTTLEEDELREREQHRRPWYIAAGQVVAAIALLASVAGTIVYLSRPVSADTLYAAITAKVESDDDPSLGRVENEVNDFLTRFADDPRAEVLRGYKERIDLDKLDRKLQREARNGSSDDRSLLPAERLYLQGIAEANNSPEKSLTLLQSLVDLYGAEAPKETAGGADAKASAEDHHARSAESRTADVVQLATRRIKSLEAEAARQQLERLTALEKRMAVAAEIAKENPEVAAAMYRAIIRLYADDAAAVAVVAKARDRLAELEKK